MNKHHSLLGSYKTPTVGGGFNNANFINICCDQQKPPNRQRLLLLKLEKAWKNEMKLNPKKGLALTNGVISQKIGTSKHVNSRISHFSPDTNLSHHQTFIYSSFIGFSKHAFSIHLVFFLSKSCFQ